MKNLRRRLFGPSYNEVAEAARAMAQAIVANAHYRAYDSMFHRMLSSEPLSSTERHTTCTAYADEHWRLFVELHEQEALTKFEELNSKN